MKLMNTAVRKAKGVQAVRIYSHQIDVSNTKWSVPGHKVQQEFTDHYEQGLMQNMVG